MVLALILDVVLALKEVHGVHLAQDVWAVPQVLVVSAAVDRRVQQASKAFEDPREVLVEVDYRSSLRISCGRML